jgi:hypothetical protein
VSSDGPQQIVAVRAAAQELDVLDHHGKGMIEHLQKIITTNSFVLVIGH